MTFDPHAQRVYSFDPKDGKMQPFSPLEGASFVRWGLSPDGSQVALVPSWGRKIIFVRLSDGSRREMEFNAPAIAGMDWTADSNGVFVATRGANGSNELIRVELGEEPQVLLKRDRG
jgi:hypothetical protein